MVAILMVASTFAVCFTASAAGGIAMDTTGTLTLYKQDSSTQVGEDGRKEPVSGASFTAYQVLALTQNTDGTNTGEGTYVVTDAFVDVIDANVDLTDTGYLQSAGALFGSTEELEAIIPQLLSASKNVTNGVNFTEDNSTAGKYVATDLPLGVYLVVETAVPDNYNISTSSFLVTIPEWDGDANNGEGAWNYSIEAQPKDNPVTIDKTTNGLDQDVYAIGDNVPFTITAAIPDYGVVSGKDVAFTAEMTDAEYNSIKYVITDTMTDAFTLTDEQFAAITVKVNDDVLKKATSLTQLKARGEQNSTDKADYFVAKEVKATGETVITITFSWTALDKYQGNNVVVDYSAVLDQDADTATANPNHAEVTYTNNPELSHLWTPENPGDDNPYEDDDDDDTNIFTYEMHLNKTFDGATVTGNDVTAVTFTLTDASGAQIPVIKTGDGTYAVWTKGDNGATSDITLGTNGKFVVKGLKDGTYFLEETKTMDGFSKLPASIEIVVKEDTTTLETDGHIGADASNVVNNNGKAQENKLSQVGDNRNSFEITVNNVEKQFNLPVTGGLGLWMFTIAGGVLLASAIIFFSVIRKKSDQK
jgi:fimbrial isopeptide formation D2 family protein/LPXTG-motif cell wall-anchored protein